MIRLLSGDARDVLPTLPAESVHTVVTSPPYYGLRDYGTALWDGGDAGCDHTDTTFGKGRGAGVWFDGGKPRELEGGRPQPGRSCARCGAVRVDRQIGLEATPDEYLATMVAVFREVRRVLRRDGTCWVNVGSSYASGDKRPTLSPASERVPENGTAYTGSSDYPAPDCAYPDRRDEPQDGSPSHRGRTFDSGLFGQRGLPPDEMIARDSERLASLGVLPLRPDVRVSTTPSSSGNALDASGPACEDVHPVGALTLPPAIPLSARMAPSIDDTSLPAATSADRRVDKAFSSRACDCGSCGICWAYLTIPLLKFKAKDLMMMPSLLALALQADGWFVRSDIIWAKPNPMPELCRDRPTSAHEHVFLLTKSARYFYDSDAVREDVAPSQVDRVRADRIGGRSHNERGQHSEGGLYQTIKIPGGWDRGDGAHGTIHRDGRTSAEYQDAVAKAGRNLRNVWDISTEAFKGAHFATMPTSVVERCIKAGTSERGCCAACGKPWVRMTEYGKAVPLLPSDAGRKATWTIGDAARDPDSRTDTPLPRHYRPALSTGWSPGCQCDALAMADPDARLQTNTKPCVVLDPFAGAGTTLLVADRLQRDAIGIELNPEYLAMTQQRIESDAGLFANVEEAHQQNPDLPLVPPESDTACTTLLDYLERATLSSDAELCDAR